MNAEQIRKLDIPEYDERKANMRITVAGLKVFREFTAQLAEMNEYLKRIAYPPEVVIANDGGAPFDAAVERVITRVDEHLGKEAK